MNTSHTIPDEILSFCHTCRDGLKNMTENRERIELMRNLLPDLLREKKLFNKILSAVVDKADYPDLNYPTMFDSELILYNDPEHLFSLRMFLWGADEYDPIHDHNSWGVIGPVTGDLEVLNYRREDDGTIEGFARLLETDRRMVPPGDTYFVLPLDAGIHKTGNPGTETIVQVSVYGKGQVIRNHINGYEIDTNRCYPIYAPKIKKRLLAEQALSYLGAGA